jgi:hypothetical protein
MPSKYKYGNDTEDSKITEAKLPGFLLLFDPEGKRPTFPSKRTFSGILNKILILLQ